MYGMYHRMFMTLFKSRSDRNLRLVYCRLVVRCAVTEEIAHQRTNSNVHTAARTLLKQLHSSISTSWFTWSICVGTLMCYSVHDASVYKGISCYHVCFLYVRAHQGSNEALQLSRKQSILAASTAAAATQWAKHEY
jgi:hypothetical protein